MRPVKLFLFLIFLALPVVSGMADETIENELTKTIKRFYELKVGIEDVDEEIKKANKKYAEAEDKTEKILKKIAKELKGIDNEN